MINIEANRKKIADRIAARSDRSADRSATAAGLSSKRDGIVLESLLLPSPHSMGAPHKFKSWRPGQSASIMRVIDTEKRGLILCLPTGAGKSLIYTLGAILYLQSIGGGRVVILTSTKPLMDQLMGDMKGTGIIDLRGKGNYGCVTMNPGGDLRREYGLTSAYYSCNDGLCHAGVRCELKRGGCSYYDRWREVKREEIVLTNYQKWFNEAMAAEKGNKSRDTAGGEEREYLGLGKFDIMVLDEAHNAVEELCSFLSTEVKERECKELGIMTPRGPGWSAETWRQWAGTANKLLRSRLEVESSELRKNPEWAIKKRQGASAMARRLEVVAEMKGRWVIKEVKDKVGFREWKFDPVWPTEYAERYLFQQIPKLVFSSATARLKTAELLGLELANLELHEQDSTFPAERRPIIHIPCMQMNYRNEQKEEARRWIVGKIDKVLAQRMDRKGIIQTKSYKRRNYVLSGSRFQEGKGILLYHDSHSVHVAIEEFKLASPPKCLISPSISTGYDFPYEMCEYQIIMKIPFPDTREEVVKERCKEDPEYGAYVAAQELVQMAGRGMRAEDDLCETIILDDNIVWFIRRFKKFFPLWFLKAYRSTNMIPRPPAKIFRRGND